VGVLQRFERRLENLVQGAFARTFGGWVEPVEIAAALTREAEDKKAIVAAGRVLVPNTYTVELSQADADRLGEYDQALRTELGTMVGEAATEHGWSFVGPIDVRFDIVESLDTGAFRVRSAVQAGEVATPAPTSGPTLYDGNREIPINHTLTLGRGTDVDVQLHDTGVSRRHAEVRVVEGQVEVHDLGSTNGIRVNGQKVTAATLTEGDVVTLGSSELVFRSGR
jgi:hypothetical protein